jgi:hypothetical protein
VTLFKRTNSMHMTTSVSLRLNKICILFKITAFFIIMLFYRLYVRIDIWLPCGKHLHDWIISLKGEVWVHKYSLKLLSLNLYASLGVIEVHVPRQESEMSCIFVLWVSILPLSTMYLLDVGTAQTVLDFFDFSFY